VSSEWQPEDRAVGAYSAKAMELLRLVRPGRGYLPGSSERIWDLVMEDESTRLPGIARATSAAVWAACRAGDWPMVSYLAAVCARDHGVESLAESIEKADPKLWKELRLRVCEPLVVEVPSDQLDAYSCRQKRQKPKDAQMRAAPKGPTLAPPSCHSGGGASRGGSLGKLTERLGVGFSVQLAGSRIRRLKLERAQMIQVWEMSDSSSSSSLEEMKNLTSQVGRAYVPGGWFRVLQYPLCGDRRLALLRPAGQAFSQQQRRLLETQGETLISHCAKMQQWELVETLLRAKVPMPVLSNEFDGLCGQNEVVKQQWRRDLAATMSTSAVGGWVRRPQSVLELAVLHFEQGPDSGERFARLLQVLIASTGDGGFLGAGDGSKPVIVVAAEYRRWDIVASLLDVENVPLECSVGAEELLRWLRAHPQAEAPSDIQPRVECRAYSEAGPRFKSMREYFLRLHAGEVVHGMFPRKFELDRGGFLLEANNSGLRILDASLQVGDLQHADVHESAGPSSHPHSHSHSQSVKLPLSNPAPHLAFVEVTKDELEDFSRILTEGTLSVLPIVLDKRRAKVSEPDSGCWIVVVCPGSYIHPGTGGEYQEFQVPSNVVPTPEIVPLTCCEIQVLSPCCRQGLEQVTIQIGGCTVGKTNAAGKLLVKLHSARKYSCTAPAACKEEVLIDMQEQGTSSPRSARPNLVQTVQLIASGELHFYVSQIDEEGPESVWVTPNSVVAQQNLADATSTPLQGKVTMKCYASPSSGPQLQRRPVIRPPPPTRGGADASPCSIALESVQIETPLGQRYKPLEDHIDWCSELKNDCVYSLSWMNPRRICEGHLKHNEFDAKARTRPLSAASSPQQNNRGAAAGTNASCKAARIRGLPPRCNQNSASHFPSAYRPNGPPSANSAGQRRRPASAGVAGRSFVPPCQPRGPVGDEVLLGRAGPSRCCSGGPSTNPLYWELSHHSRHNGRRGVGVGGGVPLPA